MKKKFIIAGIIGIVLIFIVLILIVAISSITPTENITMNNVSPSTAPEVSQNTVSNTTQGKKKSDIKGDIEYYELEDGNTIPIPPTFSYVEGELDTGAVIEDKNGNQFVWVPVNDYDRYYNRFLFDKNDGLSNEEYEKNLKDLEEYELSYNDSVRNYEGFYIARYEAGRDKETSEVLSQEGIMPWTGVTWQQAKDYAFGMYGENDVLQSDLVNSYAWDYTCQWLSDSGIDVDDSTSYGNYQNSIENLKAVYECGSNRKCKTNNIYDMAGNAWELTTESVTFTSDGNYEKLHVGRGGGYWNNGDEYPISSRSLSDGDGANISVGFRVVLYLK